MKRFKNILVAYDDAVGGDDMIGEAVGLARENSARLTIVTVLNENQSSVGIANETDKRLKRLALSVEHAGIKEVQTKVLLGTAFLEIIRQVIAGQHDLVIARAEAGSVLKNVFFGSTATHLMRKCPCPVWIMKPGHPIPYRKILAAVDPQVSASEDPFNVKIMDLATSLASHEHATLHIVHAWDVRGSDADTLRSEIRTEQRNDIIEKHEREHRAALHDLMARYPMDDIEHQVHLRRELPEQAITKIVEEEQIDLIVMGTVARTGVPGFLIGNAAESVLSSVTCGMLTVKPDGFETPVALPERGFAENPDSQSGSQGDLRIA